MKQIFTLANRKSADQKLNQSWFVSEEKR